MRTAWMTHGAAYSISLTISGLLLCAAGRTGVSDPPDASKELSGVVIQAPEPRFVAPTRRDRVGRIWAPVLINGKGPFRLVLDTGASASGVTASVARRLGILPDPAHAVLLSGVNGSVAVPTIRVNSFTVGDLTLAPATLPIITDALGGADGVLASRGFENKRIYIDFRRDLVTIARSHDEIARAGYVSIPLEVSPTGLLMIHARAGGVRVEAIIDTGAQATIGNEVMREALVRRNAHRAPDQVIDVNTEAQEGEAFPSPPIELGAIEIHGARITYGDMHIFEHWHLSQVPALLIGMDVIGRLDIFVIDYRHRELQLRTRAD